MRHNQALANKQHDRQSLRAMLQDKCACASYIVLPINYPFRIGLLSLVYSLFFILFFNLNVVWSGRLLP